MLINNSLIVQNNQFLGKKSQKKEQETKTEKFKKLAPKALLGAGFLVVNNKTDFLNKFAQIATGTCLSSKINEYNQLFNNTERQKFSQLGNEMFAKNKLENIVDVLEIGQKDNISNISSQLLKKYEQSTGAQIPKIIFDKNKTLLNTVFKSVQEGSNACYINQFNLICKPKDNNFLAFSEIHEIGHSINANSSKFWNAMQYTGNILPMTIPLIAATALVKDKKEKNEKPKGFFDKATTFIKNHVGALTFAMFIPKLAEEAKASLRACEFAKPRLESKTYNNLVKNYRAAWGTYLCSAVATSVAVWGINKLRDLAVNLISKKKTTKSNNKTDNLA